MRDIRFRAKVVNNDPMVNPEDGWVEGFYFQDLTQGEIRHFIFNCPMTWEVISDTIGQFTGLKDSNGVDIYEGDLLECPQVPKVPLEVYYNLSNCSFDLAEHTHTEGILNGTSALGDMLSFYPDMHVIGNIHDKNSAL